MTQDTMNLVLDELADDARDYLEKLERLRATPPSTDVYLDAQVDVEIAIGVLMVHSTSTHELLEEMTDNAEADNG